jgi:hypothetical protein
MNVCSTWQEELVPSMCRRGKENVASFFLFLDDISKNRSETLNEQVKVEKRF